jgi:hypothetical protein
VPATPAKNAPESNPVGISPATMKRFADMAAMLPRSEGDGAERIINQILNSQSVQDTNEIWGDLADAAKLVGQELTFETVKVMESDYTDGLGVWLLVEAVKNETGEAVMFGTGSVSIVGQLVLAYTRDEFPFAGKIVQSDKATKDGYYPQHIKVTEGSVGVQRSFDR